jgi:hypothetical protein
VALFSEMLAAREVTSVYQINAARATQLNLRASFKIFCLVELIIYHILQAEIAMLHAHALTEAQNNFNAQCLALFLIFFQLVNLFFILF